MDAPQQVGSAPMIKSRTVRFMKHLAIAAKKMTIRQGKKRELKEHLAKIKDLAVKKASRGRIESEIKALDNKITDLVDKESRFFNVVSKDDKIITQLKNKVNNLAVQLQSFKQLQGKIETEERSEISEIKDIENNIKRLETIYNKLKKSKKKHHPDQLQAIEYRLQNSKERLKKLKKK